MRGVMICDRCHEPIEKVVTLMIDDEQRYDLCKDCRKSFDAWMQNIPTKKGQKPGNAKLQSGLSRMGDIIRTAGNNVRENTKNMKMESMW